MKMNKSSYVGLGKIASIKQMRECGDYIARAKKAPHANAKMTTNNVSLRGDGRDVLNLFLKRLREARVKPPIIRSVPEDQEKKRKHRRRIIGISAMCKVPLEYFEKVNPKKWAERTLQYLDDVFGRDNVLVAVLHMDERVPHVHAIIIPVAHDGCLSSTRIYAQDKDKEPEDLEGRRHGKCEKPFLRRIQTEYYNACHELNASLSQPVPGGLLTHEKIVVHRNWLARAYADMPALPDVTITPPTILDRLDPESYAKKEVQRFRDQAMDVIQTLGAKAFLFEQALKDKRRMEENLHKYDAELQSCKNQLLETQKRFRTLQELHCDVPLRELCQMMGFPIEETKAGDSIMLPNHKILNVPTPVKYQPYDVPTWEAEPTLDVLARAMDTTPENLAKLLRPLIDPIVYERLVTYKARWQLRMNSPVAKTGQERWDAMTTLAGVEDESVGRSAQLLATLHDNFGIARNAAMKLYDNKLPMACNSHGDAVIERQSDDGLDGGIMVVGSKLSDDGRLVEQHLGSFRSEPLIFNPDSSEKTVITSNAIEALSLLSIPRFSALRVIVSGEADSQKVAKAALQKNNSVTIVGYARGRRRHRHWELRKLIEMEGGKVQMLDMSDLEMRLTGFEAIAVETQRKPSLISRIVKLLGLSASASIGEPTKPSVSQPAPPPAVREVPPIDM